MSITMIELDEVVIMEVTDEALEENSGMSSGALSQWTCANFTLCGCN